MVSGVVEIDKTCEVWARDIAKKRYFLSIYGVISKIHLLT
jgi:hypothetical protein